MDCSDVESTYASVTGILDVDRQTLDDVFDRYHSAHRDDTLVDEQQLKKTLADVRGCITHLPEFWTIFFHATRSVNPKQFWEEGLWPLNRMLDRIWFVVFGLLRSEWSVEAWQRFRRRVETTHPGHYAELYRMKTGDSYHRGPYGFLIRDVPLTPRQCGVRDHLSNPPELVQDICLSFKEDYSIDLEERYRAASRPCLVKFRSPCDPDAVWVALNYLYLFSRGLDLTSDLGYSFNGKGRTVPADWIDGVEVLSERP